MQKSYFLLPDFNDLQKHIEQLILNLAIDKEAEIEATSGSRTAEESTFHDSSAEAFETRASLISKYQTMLTSAKICVPPNHAGQVNLGVYVKLKEIGSKTKTVDWYWIGSSWMKIPLEKRTGATKGSAHQVTINAPLAQALRGKKKGETTEVELPEKKTREYKIEEISL